MRVEIVNSDVSANRSQFVIGSPDPYQSLHRLNQLLCVVADAVFENDLDLFDVADVGGGFPFTIIRSAWFARSDRADARPRRETLRR